MSETRTLTLQNPRPGIASATIVFYIDEDGKPQEQPLRSVVLHVKIAYSTLDATYWLKSILGAKAYYARNFQNRTEFKDFEKPVWKEGQG